MFVNMITIWQLMQDYGNFLQASIFISSVCVFCVGECVCVYDKDREILYIWRLLQSSTTVGGCALAPARLSVASSIDYIYKNY